MDQFQHLFFIFLSNWAGLVEEFWLLFGAIFALMCWLTWRLRDTVFWKWSFFGAFTSLVMQPGLYFIAPPLTEVILDNRYVMHKHHLYGFLSSCILAFSVIFLAVRYTSVAWDMLSHKLTRRTSIERNRRTDIRSIQSFVPAARKSYDPRKYFDAKRGLFLGLDERNKPVYVPWTVWRRSHIDIFGTTGAGKGVAAQVMACQASMSGESLIAIAPKQDEFLEHVLYQTAAEAGIPYLCIDLGGSIAQWNPFSNKTSIQIQELCSAGFSLGERGSDADFYRLDDRRAARIFSGLADVQRSKPIDAYTRLLKEHPKLAQEAKKFVNDLEEVALLPVVATAHGLDLADAIARGAIIYVRGSMRNPSILKLQRMFLTAVMQIVEQRDRARARHVCFFLDEFKYLISRPSLELLGAIRDKRAHAILAHQSLGDLRDCPGDMDPDAVVAAVNENTAIKIAYSVKDPDTAEWLAKMSGQILVDEEVRLVSTNLGLAETSEPSRTLRQAERALIDTNMLQALPERCAALFGVGLARFFFTSPIMVTKSASALQPTVPVDEAAEVQANGLPVQGVRAQTVGAGVIDVD